MEDKKLIETICRYVAANHSLPSELEGAEVEKVKELTQKLMKEKMINSEKQKMKIRDARDKSFETLVVDRGMLKAKYGIKL